MSVVLQLERINRGDWFRQKAERWIVRHFPNYAISKNMTIGMAQISVASAKDYFKEAPQRYLEKMLEPGVSIDICAYIIRKLLDQYEYNYDPETDQYEYLDLLSERGLSDDDKISLFIASKYICGANVSLKKYVMVYMTVIANTHPAMYTGNG